MSVKVGAFLAGLLQRRRREASAADDADNAAAIPSSASALAQAESWTRDGIAHYERGDLAAALPCFEHALEIAPDCFLAQYHLGLIGAQQGEPENALDRFYLATHFAPSFAAAYRELGRTLQRLHRLDRAEEACARACALDPADAANHFAAAAVSKARGDLEQAVRSYQAALERKPRYPEALCNLGHVLHQLGRGDEARQYHELALAIDPDFVEVIHNQGLVLLESGDPEGALSGFRRALALRPGELAAQTGEAHALRDLGRIGEALRTYDAVLARQPDFGDAVANRCYALLANGDFARGWAEYERRFETGEARAFSFPRWRGEALHDQALLVHAEQGLGDEIMFASCLPDVMARVSRCVIECNTRLAALFHRSFPGARVRGGLKSDPQDWLEEHPDIGRQIAIGSLPALMRNSAAAFPARPGYLRADGERVARWRSRLAALGGGLKVGISWRGGTPKTRMRLRSIRPALWRPLLSQKDVCFVSLQYGEVGPALAEFETECGIVLEHWPQGVEDLDENAALMTALDLVISVDNTSAHLAGALGLPVWILLSHAPEWRYLARGERLPWYPSARLFRQIAPGRWESVIAGVGDALRAKLVA